MTAAALTPFLALFAAFAWIAFGVFLYAARVKPRINVLSERTFIAFEFAMLGTVSTLLRWNSDTGFILFPRETASAVFAVTILTMLLTPTLFLVLFVTGRLK